jgi:hypothetical protein
MTHRQADDAFSPRPERLAAYADGELDAAERRAVEGWLDGHPEAAEELAALHRLSGWWQQTQPPAPPEEAWSEVLQRIEAALPPAAVPPGSPAARPVRKRRLLPWGAAAFTATAAAVFLAFFLRTPPGRDGTDGYPEQNEVWSEESDPLVVADNQEVEIIRLHAVDHDALPVGEPPLHEPLVLASPDDVRLRSFKPAQKDLPSTVRMDDDGGPMIVVHLDPY